MSSPFSADQPGPGPRDRRLLLWLLSPSTLPLRPPWGWLQLPGHWFPGLGSSLYSVVICPATVPAGICIVGPSSLPGEGATGGPGAWFHSLAPSSLPFRVFSHWQSQAFLSPRPSSYLSVPSPALLSPEEPWNPVEAASLRFLWEAPHLQKRQRFLEGRPRLLAPSLCKPGVWVGGGWCSRPLWLTSSFNWIRHQASALDSSFWGTAKVHSLSFFLYVPNFIWWKCKLSPN